MTSPIRRRRRYGPSSATLLLMVLVGALTVAASRLSRIAGWIPLVVLGVTLVLLLIQGTFELRQSRSERTTADHAAGTDRRVPSAGTATSVSAAVAWMVALLALIIVLGSAVGSAVFGLGFLRWHARASWTSATVFAGLLGVTLYVSFEWILRTTLHPGWLSDWLLSG